MRHIALVSNRESGSGTDAAAVERELRRRGAEVELFDVERVGDAAGARFERIVVAGGDGSVAPAAEVAAAADVPLAVVPTGTANDFARALGIPLEREEACALAVNGGRLRAVDVARMDDHPFVNVASAGLAPPAARSARPLKPVLGRLAYSLGAAKAGLTASPVPCRVVCEDRELFAGSAWQVIVANSGAFGAGARIAVAEESDGRLDVTVVEAGPRIRLLRHAWGLRRGHVTEQPGVHHARGRTVDLELPAGAVLNVDGELRPHGGASFTVEPGAVRVVCP